MGERQRSFGLSKRSPKQAKDDDSVSPTLKGSKSNQRGHFLTLRDRAIILEGPEPRRKTKLQYRGDRVDAERRAYKVTHARILREAKRDARGALEDLAFLAQHLREDWLYDVVTENRPLYSLTMEEEPSLERRQLVDLMGYPYSPVETFLRHVMAKLGWQPWRVEEPQDPKREGGPVVRRRKGAFVAVRLAASMEAGLNEKEGDHPTHLVQIVSRQDPAGMMEVWGYPERRSERKGADKPGRKAPQGWSTKGAPGSAH